MQHEEIQRHKDLREALRLGNSSSSSLSPSARGTITERTWKKRVDKRVIKVMADLVMSCQEGHRALKHGDPRLAPHSRHLLHFLVLCAQRVDWHLAWISSLINCSLWCCCCSSPRDLSPCRCHWGCRASGLLEKVAQLSGFVEAALASDKDFFHLFHRFSGFRLLIVYMVLKSDHLKWNWDDGVIANKERESAWKWT